MWSKLLGTTLAWAALIAVFLAPFTWIRTRWLAALTGAGLLAALLGVGLLAVWLADRRAGR